MLGLHGAWDRTAAGELGAYNRRQPSRTQVLFMDRIRRLCQAAHLHSCMTCEQQCLLGDLLCHLL